LGLKNIQFILNRDEYTPSVYSQTKAAIKRYRSKRKLKKLA